MSHEVVFLPHILGQTWAQALAAARTAAREEDPRIVAARLEPWPDLVLHAAQILGQIEEFRGRGQRELVHPVTRLRFTFFGEDGVIALPYWYDGPVARMAATMAFRFAHAVESDTGLAAYDPQQRTPLAEMGLEKFVAGYLRGRERALEQVAARGPVPVGHALPTGRSSTRRELGAGPAAAGTRAGGGAEVRRNADAREPRREGRAVPRQNAEVRPGRDSGRPTDPARLRPAGTPARSGDAAGRGTTGGPRQKADQRQPADSGPIAGSGWLRRGGKPARGEQAPRPGKAAEPRRAPRRGEPSPADQAQRPRRPDPDAPRRGDADQAQRSGRAGEPRKAARRERPDAEPAPRQRPRKASGDQPPDRRRPDRQPPRDRREPPELPKGR